VKRLKYPWLVAMSVSVAAGVFASLTIQTLCGLSAILGWLTAALALLLALIILCADVDRARRARSSAGLLSICLIAAATMSVFVAQCVLADHLLRIVRATAKAEVARANLRGIGQAMRAYSQEYGELPPNFGMLIQQGSISERQLLVVNDPDWSTNQAQGTTAFRYIPGAGAWPDDAALIIAYEQPCENPLHVCLKPKKGRCVLFGDGRVELLTQGRFEQAWQGDRLRREELGWPLAVHPAEKVRTPVHFD
jgi:hypothetical protein